MEGSEKPNLAPQGKLEDELLKLKQTEEALKAKIDELSMKKEKLESGERDKNYDGLMDGINDEITDASAELISIDGQISYILKLKTFVEEDKLGDKSLDGMTPS